MTIIEMVKSYLPITAANEIAFGKALARSLAAFTPNGRRDMMRYIKRDTGLTVKAQKAAISKAKADMGSLWLY